MKTDIVRNEIHPNKKSQTFLDALNSSGGTPMEQLSPEEARSVLVSAQKVPGMKLPTCDVERRNISVSGGEVLLYIVRPQGAREKLPAFMFFHGGGWVIGDFETHERLVRDLVVESGFACVFVEYSRSPEARYPQALNECFEATKWVQDHGDELNIDGAQLAVAGNSAGGNLAAAVCLKAKNEGGPRIKFQYLMWPVTNSDFETESYVTFQDDHFLTRNMMKWFWDSYLPENDRRNELYASMAQAKSKDLEGLPPALFQTAECDVLRDEGEAFARKLDEAGVDVTMTRYLGMIHDFGLLNPLSEITEVKASIRQAGQELRKYLTLQ